MKEKDSSTFSIRIAKEQEKGIEELLKDHGGTKNKMIAFAIDLLLCRKPEKMVSWETILAKRMFNFLKERPELK